MVSTLDDTAVRVVVYDMDQHNWASGGVTANTALKLFAELQLPHYGNEGRFQRQDDGSLYWYGWTVRLHGDDNLPLEASDTPQRRLALVGTYDGITPPPGTDATELVRHSIRRPENRGTDTLQRLLRDKFRGSSTTRGSLHTASSVRDTFLAELFGHLLPAS